MGKQVISLSVAPKIAEKAKIVARDLGFSLSAWTTMLYVRALAEEEKLALKREPKVVVEKKEVGRPRLSEELKMCRKIADELQKMFNRKKASEPKKYEIWWRHYEAEMHRILKAKDSVKMAAYDREHPWWYAPTLAEDGNYYYVPSNADPMVKGGDGEIPEDFALVN